MQCKAGAAVVDVGKCCFEYVLRHYHRASLTLCLCQQCCVLEFEGAVLSSSSSHSNTKTCGGLCKQFQSLPAETSRIRTRAVRVGSDSEAVWAERLVAQLPGATGEAIDTAACCIMRLSIVKTRGYNAAVCGSCG